MTVEELQTRIRDLDDTQFQQLKSWVVTVEENRRAAQPEIEQAKQEAEAETATKITQQLAEEHPELVEKPAVQSGSEIREWETWHPLRESTHYRYGDETQHGGKVWRDVLDPTGDTLNVWEPGSEGIDERYWVEETEPETEETSTESDTPETEDTAEEPTAPAWQAGIAVNPGQKYTHNGNTYEVIQPHTTQQGWEPPAVPALWKKL